MRNIMSRDQPSQQQDCFYVSDDRRLYVTDSTYEMLKKIISPMDVNAFSKQNQ